MRRGLLLIAKIIQNLANNVLFGTKEPYMFPLNLFLVQNIHVVMGFLREISVSNWAAFFFLQRWTNHLKDPTESTRSQ